MSTNPLYYPYPQYLYLHAVEGVVLLMLLCLFSVINFVVFFVLDYISDF